MKKESEVFEETLKELGFHGYKPSQMTNSDYWMCTTEAMRKYAEQFKPKWITIELEMPPKGFILFWYEGESHPVVWYNPGIKSETWIKNNKGSIWMPLPEKPEL